MAKAKKEKKVEVEEAVLPEAPKEKVEPKKAPEAPRATGKFFVEQREEGAVVIGKEGQVVSNPMPFNKAEKLADKMNRAR